MVMSLFLGFIFYDRMQDEKGYIRNNIYLEMQNYSLGSDKTTFSTKETDNTSQHQYYTLYEDEEGLYILAPQPTTDTDKMMPVVGPAGTIFVPYANSDTKALKIWYPKETYKARIAQMQYGLLWQFILFELGALVVSLLAAWYTLKPLRRSVKMMEDFMKDMIHDLNTPLSAILLNLKMIDKEDEEIEGIRTAAATIGMLHQNLDTYLKGESHPKTTFNMAEIITEQVTFFTPLYDYLTWEVSVGDLMLHTDRQAFSRIVYNLMNNACKYNTNDGKVQIALRGTVLSICNSSYGVKHPQKVFERFYKESERGLGIGLHIVDKLCRSLQIGKHFRVEGTDVVVELECSNIIARKE